MFTAQMTQVCNKRTKLKCNLIIFPLSHRNCCIPVSVCILSKLSCWIPFSLHVTNKYPHVKF